MNTEHFWTLAIEEQFYLIWPVCFCLCPRRFRLSAVLVLLLVVAPGWRELNLAWLGPDRVNRRRADLAADFLLSGCLLAVAGEEGRTRHWLAGRAIRSPWAVCLAAAGAVVITGLHRETGWGVFRPPVNGLCVAVLVNRLVRREQPPGSWLDRAFNLPPVVWVGRVSFSLYLWQQIVCVPEAVLGCRYPWNIGAAVLLAAGSYHLIEQPMLWLRRRLGSATVVPPPSSTAPAA